MVMMTCDTELGWSWTPLWSCHRIPSQWTWTADRASGEDPANIQQNRHVRYLNSRPNIKAKWPNIWPKYYQKHTLITVNLKKA